MIDVSQIVAAVDARQAYSIDVLKRLLQASREGEDATQATVSELFANLGWRVQSRARQPATITTAYEFAHSDEIDERERVTVVAQPPEAFSTSDAGALLLWAHPDGMPFDGARNWSHDPFAGTIDNGLMYGWGIADDLSGVAALLAVAAILNDLSGLRPRVALASTPSKGHASGVLAALDMLENVGAGIYLHPAESGHGLDDIKARAPGMLRLRLTTIGRQPETLEPNHTLYADQAVDPIEPMFHLIQALRALNAARAGQQGDGKAPTMMVSALRAGDSISRAPATCEAVVTFSMPPGENLEATRLLIGRTVEAASREHNWLVDHPAQIDWLFGSTGVETPPDHPLYVAVASAVEDVVGRVPRYYGGHIASEIRQPILNHGIPGLGIGPRSGSLAQAGATSDEWLDLDDFFNMIAVCILSAYRWSAAAVR